MAADFPGPWQFIYPSMILYVALAAVVYFLAPRIASMILPDTRDSKDSVINWNETMIFCSGLAFIGWGLLRLSDSLSYLLGAAVPGQTFGAGEMVPIIASFLILAAGFILTTKFYRVSAWMNRKTNGEQASAPLAVTSL